MKGLAHLKGLTQLDLFYTDISDAGLKELAGLENLTLLKLNRLNVSDARLKYLAGLRKAYLARFVGFESDRRGAEAPCRAQEPRFA